MMSDDVSELVDMKFYQKREEYIDRYLSHIDNYGSGYRINALSEYRYGLRAVLPILRSCDKDKYSKELGECCQHLRSAYSIVVNCAVKKIYEDIKKNYRTVSYYTRFANVGCAEKLDNVRALLCAPELIRISNDDMIDLFDKNGTDAMDIMLKLSKASNCLSEALDMIDRKRVRMFFYMKSVLLPLLLCVSTGVVVYALLEMIF